ncbi:hypothetical protein [Planobispora takensis]|uniref:hypothetical protein n=1 Tax=Planobispora takensis TaxID=1367882 RepID=UPI001941CA91|nr:hypothetical protein [Planobispora takensis]
MLLVVLALAALAILAGVVMVAMGKGGELTEFAPDVPPLALPEAGQLNAVDFMALQLPVSLVGYHTQSVDEALQRVANALSERDTRIAVLEQRVSELLASRLQARQEVHAAPAYGPITQHKPEIPREEPAEVSGDAAGSFGGWEGPSSENGGAPAEHAEAAGRTGTARAGQPEEAAGHTGTANAGQPEEAPDDQAEAAPADRAETASAGRAEAEESR